MSMRTIARSSSNRNSASALASSVLPTPVGPRNRKIRSAGPGRRHRRGPDEPRRTPPATACFLTDDAARRVRSSIRSSFAVSPSSMRPAGMPVQAETTCGDIVGSDLLLAASRRRPDRGLDASAAPGELLSPAPGCVPYRSSAARPRSPSRSARSASPRSFSSRSLISRTESIALFSFCQRAESSFSSSRRSASSRRSLSSRSFDAASVSFSSAISSIFEATYDALDLVDFDGARVDLHAQPRRGLVDQVDGLVGQEPRRRCSGQTASRRRPVRSP